MKSQYLFSGKNKKNDSNCPLLKILPRVLRLNNNNNKITQPSIANDYNYTKLQTIYGTKLGTSLKSEYISYK